MKFGDDLWRRHRRWFNDGIPNVSEMAKITAKKVSNAKNILKYFGKLFRCSALIQSYSKYSWISRQ